MNVLRRGMRYPWPDTVALVLVFILTAFLFLGGVVANAAHLDSPWLVAAGAIWLRLFGVVIVPIWILLRAIDWLCAGPARRAVMGKPPR